jgi:hypothetical protein
MSTIFHFTAVKYGAWLPCRNSISEKPLKRLAYRRISDIPIVSGLGLNRCYFPLSRKSEISLSQKNNFCKNRQKWESNLNLAKHIFSKWQQKLFSPSFFAYFIIIFQR